MNKQKQGSFINYHVGVFLMLSFFMTNGYSFSSNSHLPDKEHIRLSLESTTLHQRELKAALQHELKQSFVSILCQRTKSCHVDEPAFHENAYRKLVLNALSREMRDGELRVYALQKMLWQTGEHKEPSLIKEAIGRSFLALKGKLPWPILGGHIKQSLSRQGQGVVLPTTQGTLVRAIHPGNVVFANELRGYGQLLIIEHDDGFMTLYGQNRQLKKQVGDTVSRGEIIAEVGERETDTGLYFEIRDHGNAVDPLRFCHQEIQMP